MPPCERSSRSTLFTYDSCLPKKINISKCISLIVLQLFIFCPKRYSGNERYNVEVYSIVSYDAGEWPIIQRHFLFSILSNDDLRQFGGVTYFGTILMIETFFKDSLVGNTG